MARRGQKGKRRAAKKSSRNLFVGIGAVVLMVVVVIALGGRVPFVGEQNKGKSFYVQGGESRPVLNPLQFTGMTRAAYAAAKRYPEVLDQVYCYCRCDQPPFNHKSLLSCFTDKHGAGWLLCQKEALMVAQLQEEGKTIEEIKRAVDAEFGN